ncbi:threonine-phosphate decarboxylase CobD [Azospirillum oleiclasticum]|nr:threonine-phosphate decarboxylase CobD [Azospirillum oleiclasticum]
MDANMQHPPDGTKPAVGPILHGGDLEAARAAFPDAPEPWVDLSTGINPWPYPLPPLEPELWTRLPAPGAERRLREAAAAAYGAPGAEHLAAAAGSQALIQLLPLLRPRGRVVVLGPTYAEHARCWALAGHAVETVPELSRTDADVVVAVNPNNPDGRVLTRDILLDLAERQHARGGWLVVDEAFVDTLPEASLCGDVRPGLVVLRSFGKFFGLAGLRLGLAVAEPGLAGHMRAAIGPWAVAGPALAVATAALRDSGWIADTRVRVADASRRLDGILTAGGLRVVGGTHLFRLADGGGGTQELYATLARGGVLVRRFEWNPKWLRFGLLRRTREEVRLHALLSDATNL